MGSSQSITQINTNKLEFDEYDRHK